MGRTPNKPPGNHMGRMLVQLVADTVKKTRLATAPAEAEMRRRSINGMLDEWEGPLGERMIEVLEAIAGAESPEDYMDKVREIMGEPVNQIDFILQLILFIPFALFGGGQIANIAFRNVIQKANAIYDNVPLSPADAADAVIRNILGQEAAAVMAQKAGVDASVFQNMVDLTGEVPPLDEMRTLLISGRLDPLEWQKIFFYSRVRSEWSDLYTEAHYKPLSGADIVQAYIKGLVTEAEGQNQYGIGGGLPDQFNLAVEIAGEAIGVVEANNLFNHELISEDDLRAVIAYSRINPRFEPMAALQRFHWLAPFQIEQALKAGEATPAEATKWLLQDGYPADQVAALVGGAHTTATVKAKTETVSVIVDSYEAGLITQPQAIAQLGKVGYAPEIAAIELQAYDARRILAITTQGVSAVKKGFLTGVIDKTGASNDLDSLGVDSTIRDHYLKLWAIEKQLDVKHLTAAQIGSQAKKGIITYDTAIKEWVTMGYSPPDAGRLAYEYGLPLPNNLPVA